MFADSLSIHGRKLGTSGLCVAAERPATCRTATAPYTQVAAGIRPNPDREWIGLSQIFALLFYRAVR